MRRAVPAVVSAWSLRAALRRRRVVPRRFTPFLVARCAVPLRSSLPAAPRRERDNTDAVERGGDSGVVPPEFR